MSKYDTNLFQYFQNFKNQLRVSPLNLGGTATSSGGPPGGFIGYLPQSRVGYDTAEAAISGFSDSNPYNSSGILVNASLVDNLNHIRYRLGVVEELAFTGNYISVEDNEILVASGVTVLNFAGNVSVNETAPAKVTITVVPTGYDEKVKAYDGDTTSGYLDEKIAVQGALTEQNSSGTLVLTGTGQTKVSSDDTTVDYLENKITAGNNVSIAVLNNGSNESLQISASGGSITFTELTDTPNSYSGQAGKYVRVNSSENALEFTTASGGGGSLIIKDEGDTISSEATVLDFVGSNVTATASGSGVIITVSGVVIEASFVGAKVYLTSNVQMTTDTGWQTISWNTSEYESNDSMWTVYNPALIILQEDGYYSIIGQVTLSGNLPTNERLQIGLFNSGTFLTGIYNGYFTSTSGYRSFQVLYNGYLYTNALINMKILNGEGTQPYLISGVQNTFLAVHKIHGAVQAQTSNPKIVNPYLTGYITVANETETAITWNAENFDTDDMWSSGSQIQINTPGYYHIDAACVWESIYYHGGSPFQVKIGIRLNGTDMLAQKWEWHDVDTGGDRSEGLSTTISCDTSYLTDSDYLEVVVWHSKGSSASNIIRPPAYNTYCMVYKIQ